MLRIIIFSRYSKIIKEINKDVKENKNHYTGILSVEIKKEILINMDKR